MTARVHRLIIDLEYDDEKTALGATDIREWVSSTVAQARIDRPEKGSTTVTLHSNHTHHGDGGCSFCASKVYQDGKGGTSPN